MTEKISKKLVIDASVARSTGGEETKSLTAKCCRDFLQAVLEICHQFVMTPDIRDEWDKHQSKFALEWRRRMTAKKKLVILRLNLHDELWSQVETLVETDKIRAEIAKDLLLIEAAIATDKIVISLDDKMQKYLHDLARQVSLIQDIMWINPSQVETGIIKWLEQGANYEKERSLFLSDQE